MFGKKAKELQELLTQRNSENELMKKRIEELESELARLKDQEALVLRSLTEANKTASRIEQEAEEERDKLLADAKEQLSETETKIGELLAEADEKAAAVKKDADEYSENIRTDANIFVERTIIESQMEVNKRKDVMQKMNELLKQTTDHLNEQMESFKQMLASVIENGEEQTKELCADIEKCSCNCEECENPCKPNVMDPGKKKPAEDEDEESDEEGEETAEGEETEAAEEPEEPAEEPEEPAEEPEEPAEEPSAEPEEEQTAAHLDEEKAPADEPAKFDPFVLPTEYRNPAELMKNIYYIQRRDIPVVTKRSDFSDVSPEGGITFRDEMGGDEEFPHDEKLGEIVDEVIPAS